MTNTLPSQEIKTGVQNELKTPYTHLLHLSSSPHIRSSISVPQIMHNVIIALIPATAVSIMLFNVYALLIVITSAAASVLSEFLFCIFTRRKLTLNDYSAVVTGLLFGLSLPPLTPLWMVIIGAVFSTVISKALFGGLGRNIFNPALAGRALLMLCFGHTMSSAWLDPAWGTIAGVDTVSSATPLAFLKEQIESGSVTMTYLHDSILHLFIGNAGGSIGETSTIALLLGAAWLLYKRVIGLRITLSYLISFSLLAWIFNCSGELFTSEAFLITVLQLCAGGLFLGVIFMANDPSTTPVTPNGKLIFGTGCGVLTVAFRQFSIFPEGVCFAILIMNALTPLIEMYTKPKAYGR